MSYQVEFFSGEEAGVVDLDDTKIHDKSYVTAQVSKFAPKGMVLSLALVIKKSKKVLIAPQDLPLRFKFPEEQCWLTLSLCGKFVVSGAYDHKVKVWNLKTRECKTLEGHTGWVYCVTFSPCGKFVASGGYDNKVKVWNLKTQACMALEGHTGWVRCVAFSPCGKIIQSVSTNEVKAWHLGPTIKIS